MDRLNSGRDLGFRQVRDEVARRTVRSEIGAQSGTPQFRVTGVQTDVGLGTKTNSRSN